MGEKQATHDEIRSTVKRIVSKYLAPDEIAEAEDDILSVESLDLVDIVIEIEKEYGIKFLNEEVQALETFDQLTALIHKKTGVA